MRRRKEFKALADSRGEALHEFPVEDPRPTTEEWARALRSFLCANEKAVNVEVVPLLASDVDTERYAHHRTVTVTWSQMHDFWPLDVDASCLEHGHFIARSEWKFEWRLWVDFSKEWERFQMVWAISERAMLTEQTARRAAVRAELQKGES